LLAPEPSTAVAKKNLLLVDADSKSLRMLEVSLRKGGFSVTTAIDAMDAWAKLRHALPDLIITDTKLPGDITGFEFVADLKRVADTAAIPIVFLASDASLSEKVTGLELGVDDYLTKPIYIKEVLTRVRVLLDKREKQKLERFERAPSFSGLLGDMGLVDLVQTIELGRKSGRLLIHSGRDRGVVAFRDGRVVNARCGRLVGERAFYRMLVWSEGTFSMEFVAHHEPVVIEQSPQALLMEGVRRVDEWGRLIEQLPPLEHVFELDVKKLAEKLAQIPDELNPLLRKFDGRRTLLQVIDEVDFGDLEALELAAKLFFEGLLIERAPAGPATPPSETAAEVPWAPNVDDDVDVEGELLVPYDTVPPGPALAAELPPRFDSFLAPPEGVVDTETPAVPTFSPPTFSPPTFSPPPPASPPTASSSMASAPPSMAMTSQFVSLPPPFVPSFPPTPFPPTAFPAGPVGAPTLVSAPLPPPQSEPSSPPTFAPSAFSSTPVAPTPAPSTSVPSSTAGLTRRPSASVPPMPAEPPRSLSSSVPPTPLVARESSSASLVPQGSSTVQAAPSATVRPLPASSFSSSDDAQSLSHASVRATTWSSTQLPEVPQVSVDDGWENVEVPVEEHEPAPPMRSQATASALASAPPTIIEPASFVVEEEWDAPDAAATTTKGTGSSRRWGEDSVAPRTRPSSPSTPPARSEAVVPPELRPVPSGLQDDIFDEPTDTGSELLAAAAAKATSTTPPPQPPRGERKSDARGQPQPEPVIAASAATLHDTKTVLDTEPLPEIDRFGVSRGQAVAMFAAGFGVVLLGMLLFKPPSRAPASAEPAPSPVVVDAGTSGPSQSAQQETGPSAPASPRGDEVPPAGANGAGDSGQETRAADGVPESPTGSPMGAPTGAASEGATGSPPAPPAPDAIPGDAEVNAEDASKNGGGAEAADDASEGNAADQAAYDEQLKRATTLARRGEFGRSVRAYKAALAIRANSVTAHLGLGAAFFELDNLTAALLHLERARVLAPRDPQVYVLLGAVYHSAGRRADAVKAYERFLALSPGGKMAQDVRAILRGLAP
jgi:CheY-like chemotaxis protein